MTVAATGNFGKAAAALRALIAASSTFIDEQTNLVTNGNFATDADGWTISAGWYWSSGNMIYPSNGHLDTLSRPVTFDAGSTYRVVYDYTGSETYGRISGSLGGTGFTMTPGTSVAQNVVAGSADSLLNFIENIDGATPVNHTLDNVSIKIGENIYIGEYNPDGSAMADCFAVIQRSSDVSTSVANTHYSNSGELVLMLERSIPTTPNDHTGAGSESDAEQDFYNFVDGVIEDCQALSGTAGYLMTRSWTITEIARIDTENRYFAKINVAWGLATS